MKHQITGMWALTLCGAVLASGCATGISSKKAEDGDKGLVYFLPKRDFKITVTVTAPPNATETVTVEEAPAEGDISNAFVAQIPRNYVGANKATLQVSTRGLLSQDSKTETTSGLTDVLKAAADLAGTIRGAYVPVPATCPAGTYSKTVAAAVKKHPALVCGYDVEVERSGWTTPPAGTKAPGNGKASGLYYRVALSYKVKVSKAGVEKEVILTSPSESPTLLLPIAWSGFGSNSSGFAFTDGMPTKYEQNISGELQGLLSAPSTVIGAYFSAIGNAFTRKKDLSTKEIDLLNQQNAAAIAVAKNKACADVVSASTDLAAIKAACAP